MEQRNWSVASLHSKPITATNINIPRVPEQLTGVSNYRKWRENMTALCSANGLLQFVLTRSGIIEPPIEHHLYWEWHRLRSITSRIIVCNVSKSISKEFALHVNQPQRLWTALEEQYALPDTYVARFGFEAAMSIRFSECLGVADYARKV